VHGDSGMNRRGGGGKKGRVWKVVGWGGEESSNEGERWNDSLREWRRECTPRGFIKEPDLSHETRRKKDHIYTIIRHKYHTWKIEW
jgi:hypothetical protein